MKWFPRLPHLLSYALLALGPALLGCGGDGKDVKDPSHDGPEIGKSAPEISGEAVMGEGPKTLADGRGQVVIVVFWAAFSDPCAKSFPMYQELVDKYAGDLAVIAMSVDDTDHVSEEDVKEFASDRGVSFTIVWDKSKKTVNMYKPPTTPTSYIIDREGILRHVHHGFRRTAPAEIDKEVEALLE